MSMLSEQRRKTKWVVNPTKKPLWSTDSSGIKFGKELMEKMGWSAGKGLGLNEQGIQEPLRVSFKNDTKGMGFKGNDDDWIEHQDEFNSLLNQLRSGEDSSVVKIPEEENREIKSLEEKSKTSKARVHYQKFTRGKDLSKYSENDLACILGTNKMKKEKLKTEQIIETESKSNCEISFGVTTINSGSIQNYFKRKWIINKNKSDESNANNTENFSENIFNEKSLTCNGQNVGENEEKKPKNKRLKWESEEQLPIEDNKVSESDILESSDKVGKRKRKKKENEISSDNEPIKKKKRKNSNSKYTVEGEISQENDSILAECGNLTFENHHLDSSPKKGKKEKNYLKSEIAHDEDEYSCVKEKKKKKKTEKNGEETTTSDVDLEIHGTNDGEECKSSKKKYKKEKRLKTTESCSKEIEPLPTQNDTIEFSLDEKFIKSKKIKKSKKENSEETEETGSTPTKLKEYSCSDEGARKFNIGVENDQNSFSKKKKKKKDKKEKLTEVEFSCSDHENNYLAVEHESTIEVESEKKKKKERTEKLDENNHNNENEGSLYENISEKPIKKKKDKKEKSSQHEDEGNQTVPEEGEGESVKKKKKKKKEKLHEGNESQQSCRIVQVEEPKLGKSCTERNSDGMDSSQIENNPGCGVKTEGEMRIEKLKVNLFGDEVSEKYFPQKGPNARVLKMIKWANISEFRGSNLRDVEGYGRKLMYQNQAR